MSAKPAEPQATPAGQPSTPQWLFLFYKWVTGALAGLFPGTAGNVIYSDGAGGVANEDAFNYNATTNTLNVDSLLVDVSAIVGEPGTESSGITVGGTTYTSHFKVSDINDSHPAEIIIHRHSTSLPAALIAARSNSSGSSHAAVTSGQSLFQIYAVGHDGTDYAFSSAIDFAVDGTPGSNDMPGRIGFFTAADGGQTLAERFRISNFGGLGIGGANFGTSGQALVSGGSAAAPAWTTLLSTHISDFTEASQDIIGALLVDSSSINVTYNDVANNFTIEVIAGGVDHGGLAGLSDNDHPQYLLVADIDDTPVNGEVAQPISSNWAFDHVAAADPHPGYRLESADHTHQSAGAQGGQLDHGLALTGLTDDDHTQYVLNDGTRATTVLAAASADYVRIGGGAAASELRFLEPSGGGTSYTGFKAPALAGNVMYTLPTADGTSGQVLSTNGSGTLAWATGGSGSDAAPMTPQGRLTLTTATPVMTADAAAQTTIYYTPYVGSVVPLYDGSAWTNTQFAELSIAMAGNAAWASGSVYDLYVYNDGGTIRLVTGAAWTNTTTRSESLTRVNGIYTNAATMTGRYATGSTVSIAANRATYVGTFYASANGTTTWELGGSALNGDEVRYFLWNQYNRVRAAGWCRDSTNTWTYSSTTIRQLNGSNTNRISFVSGDAAMWVAGVLQTMMYVPADTRYGETYLGIDMTGGSVPSAPGTEAPFYASGVSEFQSGQTCHWQGYPGLGYHYLQALESGHTSGFGFYGDEDMLLYMDAEF